MKFFYYLIGLGFAWAMPVPSSDTIAQTTVRQQPPANKTYSYDTVPGDPMRARIYTLENGLTIYMSVYKNAPRLYTSIAVRTGSKNDPADATGLAHYLEHMLFKGTDQYGTKDFQKESIELRKIDSLYEKYGQTIDTDMRKKIYHQIDSISGVASKHAVANEYDKLMSNIGANGTNAYTWLDETVYINDIPSNQLKKWLIIEGERFRKPILRLFHTELEAVYEEKNRSLDDDYSKMNDALFAGLFRKHTYGTQTTIGTIEHLKNPSLKKIREYYNTYYVPNNMAFCLAGDFNPDSVIRWCDQYLGGWERKPVNGRILSSEDPISAPIIKEVTGPFPETMNLAFRLPGAGTREELLLDMMNEILYNGKAGLIDLNIMQKQRLLNAGAYAMNFKDYSVHVFSGDPKSEQKLEEVKDVLLAEIEKVKKGDFPDWLIGSVINNKKLQETKTQESNAGRVNQFVYSFVHEKPWAKDVNYIRELSTITKQELVDFANKYYGNNYVVVYKRTGIDSTVQKVDKPAITPIETNRNDKSDFLARVTSMPAETIEPVFLDFTKDIQKGKVKSNLELLYTPNTENKTFTLYYILDMGSNHNRKLPVAIEYLTYLGTSKYTPEQLQQEFYKLACSFGVFNSNDQVYVYLSGLDENFDKATALFEELLADAQPNPQALKNLAGDILKKRADAKLDKNTILWNGLWNYAKYGPQSPFTNILSEKELRELKPEELTSLIRSLISYEHRILYYGSIGKTDLEARLGKLHRSPATLKPYPAETKFEEQLTPVNKVYAVDYDMTQAEIFLVSKSEAYYKNLAPSIRLFNEYFGGGMSSIMFQELRESKALAYSVFAGYIEADRIDRNNYIQAYIGAQVDKLPEAMEGLFNLMKSMPESENSFLAAQKAVLETIRTTRITKTRILFTYEAARKLKLDYDIRKDVYTQVKDMKLDAVKRFHSQHISAKRYNIMIIGNKKLLDQKVLESYGPVKWLTLEEVFGY